MDFTCKFTLGPLGAPHATQAGCYASIYYNIFPKVSLYLHLGYFPHPFANFKSSPGAPAGAQRRQNEHNYAVLDTLLDTRWGCFYVCFVSIGELNSLIKTGPKWQEFVSQKGPGIHLLARPEQKSRKSRARSGPDKWEKF